PNSSLIARQRSGMAGEARSIMAEHAAETAALKEQLDTLRARLDMLEAERQRLQQQLGVTPAPDLANVEARFASVLQENQQLKSASDQLAGQKSELENQLARLQASPAAGQVQVLREQLRDAQARAVALTGENARLRMQVPRTDGAQALSPVPVVVEPVVIDPTSNGGGARTVVTEAARIDLGSSSGPPASERAGPAGMSRGTASVSATLVTSASGGASLPPGLSRIEMDGRRVHVVASGDTLAKISTQYYGTPARWGDILAANRDVLGETNNLVVGRTLRIP
ncbi:MAG: LysM peptidoglycan-binding domain-containing protein, partial [Opitutus sp.]